MSDGADRDPSERREHDRHAIELKVEYKRLNKFFADYTKNICKGGTFIKTTKPLEIGTQFLFKLFVPTLPEPLRLTGEVKWLVRPEEVADDAEDVEPGMGIRFIYSADQEREQLEELVEKLMIGSLGQLLYSKLMGKGGSREG
jgi:type IV pilus assembly protein PilZ